MGGVHDCFQRMCLQSVQKDSGLRVYRQSAQSHGYWIYLIVASLLIIKRIKVEREDFQGISHGEIVLAIHLRRHIYKYLKELCCENNIINIENHAPYFSSFFLFLFIENTVFHPSNAWPQDWGRKLQEMRYGTYYTNDKKKTYNTLIITIKRTSGLDWTWSV